MSCLFVRPNGDLEFADHLLDTEFGCRAYDLVKKSTPLVSSYDAHARKLRNRTLKVLEEFICSQPPTMVVSR